MECRKILVIENDPQMRLILTQKLEERDYQVYIALDGIDALERLAAGPRPDIILLELDLPRMNGWSFLSLLKSNSKISTIPTLVFSNYAQRAKDRPGMRTRFMDKSESLEELMDSLYRICGEDQGLNEYAPEIREIKVPRQLKLNLKETA